MIVSVRDKNAVSKASAVLKKGGIIIYPSESSYAIGCDAASKKAMKGIIKVKKRPKEKRMIAYVANAKMAEKYCGKKISKKERVLLMKFKGRLTVVKNKKALRIPSRPFALSLLKKLKKPIITTSANISGKTPIYKISEIKKTFSGKVDLIIGAGNLPRRKPSTIVDLDGRKILRKGPISFSQIQKVFAEAYSKPNK